MGIVVLKFGGTSLRNINNQSHLLTHVKKTLGEGNKLVIVVSAIGRKGEPYATDSLLHLLESISKVINPKKKDLLMSCGEVVSTALVSHLLDSQGLPSEALTGFQAGIITDNNFNNSTIIDVNTTRITKHLEQGKIVVVAGFQGMTSDMEVTTLGRGGSDTTAVVIGGALGADRVDIFTDVPGVAIIDPHLVPDAKYIENISYDDMYSLASNGATVIHPRAVLIGKRYNIPIRILSTFEDDHPGTIISSIDNDNKIIGLAIKKQDDDNEKISILFNKDYKDEIENDLLGFILQENENIIRVIYSEEKISFIVKSEIVPDFGRKLYDLLI